MAAAEQQIRVPKAKRGQFADRYGPVAVITGASDGIGRAIALKLASAGLDLVLVARRPAELNALAEELRSTHGVAARPLVLDLSHADAAVRLDAETRDDDIGLLIAAAGFGTSGPLLEGDVTTERQMIDVNCGAVLELTHVFARRFVERGRGGIVLFGSLVGWQGTPNAANYAATKAYVQSLAEGLHVELAPKGIDILSVAPGPVSSGFAARAQMTMGSTTPPMVVADAVLTSLGRRATVVPGALGMFLTYSLSMLPRRIRVRILGNVMKGMTRHRGTALQTQRS